MLALTALADTEAADQDSPLVSTPPIDWEEIKSFFAAEIQRIGRRWFEQG
jgi:hypothetical protein